MRLDPDCNLTVAWIRERAYGPLGLIDSYADRECPPPAICRPADRVECSSEPGGVSIDPPQSAASSLTPTVHEPRGIDPDLTAEPAPETGAAESANPSPITPNFPGGFADTSVGTLLDVFA